MDLLPIGPVEFDRALNTGQIGSKFTEIDAGRFGEKFIEITPSSQWKINTKLHNTSEVDLASKSAGFIKLLHF